MGLLTGKFSADSALPADDVRHGWDFRTGSQAESLGRLESIREILTTGGRSLAQGALGWLWARSPAFVPIPGFKSVEQVAGERRCPGARPAHGRATARHRRRTRLTHRTGSKQEPSMRILITGAGGNVGVGIIPRLRAAGHDLVLSDINPLPADLIDGAEFHQLDVQAGFGLESAADGCDLLLHTPAWHGIHSRSKTEADFWRLNVDGTFWALQAARTAGISRLVFLSSMSWFGHYDKYGFTKRVGEELVEYHRQQHDLRNVTIRPHDFTPWGSDYLNRYGARLLYGGVDRADVLDCVLAAIDSLASPVPATGPEGTVVHAVRASAYTEDQLTGWEDDPIGTCDRIFPGAAALIERYGIDVNRRPSVPAAGRRRGDRLYSRGGTSAPSSPTWPNWIAAVPTPSPPCGATTDGTRLARRPPRRRRVTPMPSPADLRRCLPRLHLAATGSRRLTRSVPGFGSE